MAVIINEFEIVVEPPKKADTDSPEKQAPEAPAASLSPRDIQRLLEYQHQRHLRVLAH